MKKWIALLVPLAVVLVYLYGSGQAHSNTFGRSAAMEGNAILDSLNNAARTVTQTWTFSGATTALTIDDGKMTTADSVLFIEKRYAQEVGYAAGQVNANEHFWRSNTADEIYYFHTPLPHKIAGGTAVIDTITMSYWTNGVGNADSLYFRLEKIATNNTPVAVDSSAWQTVRGTWTKSTNILVNNGDYTVEEDCGYRIVAVCDNDGLNDIYVEMFYRIVYHIE